MHGYRARKARVYRMQKGTGCIEKGTGYIEEDAGCMGTERKRVRGRGGYGVQESVGVQEGAAGGCCRKVCGAGVCG